MRYSKSKQTKGAYLHSCPYCGTAIISVNMRNGGWAHFEGAIGLTRIKHPCLHRGEHLGKSRDETTPDLFTQLETENADLQRH